MQLDTIPVFKGRKVRDILHHNESWFSVADVCAVFVETSDAEAYWRELKQALQNEGCEVKEICHRLELEDNNGKKYFTDCANIEGLFRIIQSIQSPKASLFKHWLAKVGDETIQDFDNPELAVRRARKFYKRKGYSNEWIGLKMRGII